MTLMDQMFKPCRCTKARKAFDAFVEILCDEIDGRGLKITDETGKSVVGLDLKCKDCNNTGRLLTEEGQQIVKLLAEVKGGVS